MTYVDNYTIIEWIMLKSMRQSNILMQTSRSCRSWISLLPNLASWYFLQKSSFYSYLITLQLFSITARSHIQAKLPKLEIEFRTSIFQCSWILYFLVRQLNCKHLQKSDRGSQSFPFYQEPIKTCEKKCWNEQRPHCTENAFKTILPKLSHLQIDIFCYFDFCHCKWKKHLQVTAHHTKRFRN